MYASMWNTDRCRNKLTDQHTYTHTETHSALLFSVRCESNSAPGDGSMAVVIPETLHFSFPGSLEISPTCRLERVHMKAHTSNNRTPVNTTLENEGCHLQYLWKAQAVMSYLSCLLAEVDQLTPQC